jgi:hypothetical protein
MTTASELKLLNMLVDYYDIPYSEFNLKWEPFWEALQTEFCTENQRIKTYTIVDVIVWKILKDRKGRC